MSGPPCRRERNFEARRDNRGVRVSTGYTSQLVVGHYLAERRDSHFGSGSATHRRDLRAHPGGAAQNLRQRRLPGRKPLVLRKTETGLSEKMITRLSYPRHC